MCWRIEGDYQSTTQTQTLLLIYIMSFASTPDFFLTRVDNKLVLQQGHPTAPNLDTAEEAHPGCYNVTRLIPPTLIKLLVSL